ncbi:hypothetical protein SAMN05661096_03390 [Marivirga sericea]|uniref:Calx-beta domain-containing protein n=1 Tax=Marivirga sericea TaxID=1028 RepID=A0A1X7L130_9BACT|nr:hypothetical protein [Marivirga sericea]SMG47415.1 hypothetical protein SAMN05661096_03390 [Marivirga sericea]
MKKILYIVYIVALVPFLTGCFEEPGTSKLITDFTDQGFVEIVEANGGASPTKNVVVVPDGANVTQSIQVSFGGAVSDAPVDVSFEVVASSSTAVEGVDYTLVSAGSVTIASGEYTAPITFEVVDDILDPDNPITITFRLTNASVPILEEYGEVTITLVGLCPPELFDYTTVAGEYSTDAVGTSTDPCPGSDPFTFASTETLTRDAASDTDEAIAFTISDSFAGLYEAWYGECYTGALSSQSGTILVNTATGAVTGSGSEVYGTTWEATGLLDACNGNITYTVVNGFDDEGTVTWVQN